MAELSLASAELSEALGDGLGLDAALQQLIELRGPRGDPADRFTHLLNFETRLKAGRDKGKR